MDKVGFVFRCIHGSDCAERRQHTSKRGGDEVLPGPDFHSCILCLLGSVISLRCGCWKRNLLPFQGAAPWTEKLNQRRTNWSLRLWMIGAVEQELMQASWPLKKALSAAQVFLSAKALVRRGL